MTLTKNLLGVAALGLAVSTVASAQQAQVTSTGGGLLGQKYAQVGLGYLDVNHADRGVYAAGADVNLPVSSNFDVNVSYGHSWLENNDSLYTNDVGVDLVGYFTDGAFRPFVVGGLGYVWVGSGDDDYGTWNVGAGVEYSINSTTAVRVSADYNEAFESSKEDGSVSGTVSLNHWFTSSVGGSISVSLIEGGNLAYGANVIFKF